MKFDEEKYLISKPRARVIVLTADQFEDIELFVPSGSDANDQRHKEIIYSLNPAVYI